MSTLDRFAYDRAELTAGIVHIGVGGFHRAHQAAVIDDLLGRGLARQWAICGVGVLPADRRMRDTLRAQGFRYTLVLKHPDGVRTAREIGSIVDYLYAPDDPEAVLEKMSSPEVRIVSLTITEGGYHVDRVTGEFDRRGEAVSRDLLPGAVPSTAFGLIAEALRRRRDRGLLPFTVLSCDNIPGNGEVCRRMLSAFASAKDPELGAWIGEQVAFPNSMVDRITPATTDADRAEVAAEFGVQDAWPVVAEPFFQWVVEDDFPCGRPPLEQAGVQLVADVEPYELMKLRLLNASHQGLCYFGRLSGYHHVHEAARDPLIANLLRRYMDEEATPTLHPVPGVNLVRYKETLVQRFGNPHVLDTIARLCADSSDRIPTWLVPVVREQLAAGRPVRLSAAIVASWARYAEGVDEQGGPIEVVDRLRDKVMEHAARQRTTPTAFLRQQDLFGDLADDERFVRDYVWALESLIHRGAQATLAAL
jgi:mannitol 2-dehydrogenase